MDKKCARCGALKSRDAFYRNLRWNDGLHPYCRLCLLAYQRDQRFAKLDAANPERQRWSRRFVVHDYFDVIDDVRKAYLLGLFAADGNVLEKTPRVTLELAVKDVELVEMFRDYVAPSVRIRRRAGRGNSQEQAIIAITSAQLVAGLARWGVVPRNTWSYRWPSALPAAMKRPYLLGHFDRDGFGTISRSWGKYRYWRWGILGTPDFVLGVRNYLESELCIRRRATYARGGVSVIYVTGRDAVAIDEWLHADLPFGLERKRLSSCAAAARAACGSAS